MECDAGRVLCARDAGVCAGAVRSCLEPGAECSAISYGARFEDVERSCDGVDNDCDGEVDVSRPVALLDTEVNGFRLHTFGERFVAVFEGASASPNISYAFFGADLRGDAPFTPFIEATSKRFVSTTTSEGVVITKRTTAGFVVARGAPDGSVTTLGLFDVGNVRDFDVAGRPTEPGVAVVYAPIDGGSGAPALVAVSFDGGSLQPEPFPRRDGGPVQTTRAVAATPTDGGFAFWVAAHDGTDYRSMALSTPGAPPTLLEVDPTAGVIMPSEARLIDRNGLTVLYRNGFNGRIALRRLGQATLPLADAGTAGTLALVATSSAVVAGFDLATPQATRVLWLDPAGLTTMRSIDFPDTADIDLVVDGDGGAVIVGVLRGQGSARRLELRRWCGP